MLGRPVASVGEAVTVISGPLALIRGMVALIRGMVALVGQAVAFLRSVLGLVQGRLAAGQAGLGGLQGLLGGLGAGLGLRDPGVIQARAASRWRWASWMTSWASSASLREDDRALMRSCWKAASGSVPWVAARTPLACSIQIRLARAWRS